MGMYSSFSYQEITVRDKKKLQEIKDNKEFELYDLISDDLEVDFDNWNNHKLYDYWFDNTIAILKELAKCIEGYAEFIFDCYCAFRIYFEDGNVYFKSVSEVDWNEYEKKFFD